MFAAYREALDNRMKNRLSPFQSLFKLIGTPEKVNDAKHYEHDTGHI